MNIWGLKKELQRTRKILKKALRNSKTNKNIENLQNKMQKLRNRIKLLREKRRKK